MAERGLIVIDPGHGQFGNPHTTAPNFKDGFYEGTQNHVLGCFFKKELEERNSCMLPTCLSAVDDPLGHHAGNAEGHQGTEYHDEGNGQPVIPDLLPAIHQIDHRGNKQNGQAGSEKIAAFPDVLDFYDFKRKSAEH